MKMSSQNSRPYSISNLKLYTNINPLQIYPGPRLSQIYKQQFTSPIDITQETYTYNKFFMTNKYLHAMTLLTTTQYANAQSKNIKSTARHMHHWEKRFQRLHNIQEFLQGSLRQ